MAPLNVNAQPFVPSAGASAGSSSCSSDVAIQFEGRMSAAKALAVSKTLLYNPVCCEYCANFLRTLREYYVRAAAVDAGKGGDCPPSPHPGIWIGVSDMDHILRHALRSQQMRLEVLERRLIRSRDLLDMLHNREEIEAAIEDARSTIQAVRRQLQSVVPKCRRRLSFEEEEEKEAPPLPTPFAVGNGGRFTNVTFGQTSSLVQRWDTLSLM